MFLNDNDDELTNAIQKIVKSKISNMIAWEGGETQKTKDLSKPIQIVPLGSSVNDLVNIAAFAAHDAIVAETQANLPGV